MFKFLKNFKFIINLIVLYFLIITIKKSKEGLKRVLVDFLIIHSIKI